MSPNHSKPTQTATQQSKANNGAPHSNNHSNTTSPNTDSVTSVVHLTAIRIDQNILFRDGSLTQSPASRYTYAYKVVEFNRTRLRDWFGLTSIHVDAEQCKVHVRGEVPPAATSAAAADPAPNNSSSSTKKGRGGPNKDSSSSAAVAQQQQQQQQQARAVVNERVTHAAQAVIAMLQQPVLTYTVDPELTVALRVFKDLKQDFSARTGCWLHFIWSRRTVTCYGLDGAAAYHFLHNVVLSIRDGGSGGGARMLLRERAFGHQAKDVIKRMADSIENTSGAYVAARTDLRGRNTCRVQLYGTESGIAEAVRVIEQHLPAAPAGSAGSGRNRSESEASTSTSVGSVSSHSDDGEQHDRDGDDGGSEGSSTRSLLSSAVVVAAVPPPGMGMGMGMTVRAPVPVPAVVPEPPQHQHQHQHQPHHYAGPAIGGPAGVYTNSPYAFVCCCCGLSDHRSGCATFGFTL